MHPFDFVTATQGRQMVEESLETIERRDKKRLEREEAILAFSNSILTLAGFGVLMNVLQTQRERILVDAPWGAPFLLLLGSLMFAVVGISLMFFVIPAKFQRLAIACFPDPKGVWKKKWFVYPVIGVVAAITFAVVFTVGSVVNLVAFSLPGT
jgi:hypothetical protein